MNKQAVLYTSTSWPHFNFPVNNFSYDCIGGEIIKSGCVGLLSCTVSVSGFYKSLII